MFRSNNAFRTTSLAVTLLIGGLCSVATFADNSGVDLQRIDLGLPKDQLEKFETELKVCKEWSCFDAKMKALAQASKSKHVEGVSAIPPTMVAKMYSDCARQKLDSDPIRFNGCLATESEKARKAIDAASIKLESIAGNDKAFGREMSKLIKREPFASYLPKECPKEKGMDNYECVMKALDQAAFNLDAAIPALTQAKAEAGHYAMANLRCAQALDEVRMSQDKGCDTHFGYFKTTQDYKDMFTVPPTKIAFKRISADPTVAAGEDRQSQPGATAIGARPGDSRPGNEGHSAGSCPAGTDCKRLPIVPSVDPSKRAKFTEVYECDEKFAKYNCLSCTVGAGNGGDPTKFFTDAASREDYCRKQLQAYLKKADVPLTRGGNPMFVPMIKKVLSKSPVDTISEENSPACSLYFKQIVLYKDPTTGQPAIPKLRTQSDVDLALVDDGGLGKTLRGVEDMLASEVKELIGAKAVQKKAKLLLTNKMLFDNTIIENDTRFQQEVDALLGAKSPTACLSPEDQTALKAELTLLRDGLKQQGPSATIASTNSSRLIQAAELEKTLLDEAGKFGNIIEGAQCGNGSVVGSGDIGKKLVQDRVVDISKNADYESWFNQRYKIITGQNPPAQPVNGKISCSTLIQMQSKLLASARAIKDEFPTLGMKISPKCAPADGIVYLDGERLSQEVVSVFPKTTSSRVLKNKCPTSAAVSDLLRNAGSRDQKNAVLKMAMNHYNASLLGDLNGSCGKGSGALLAEGDAVFCAKGVVDEFLGCAGIEEKSTECKERRSYGRIFCRECVNKKISAEQAEKMKMVEEAALFTAFFLVPGGDAAGAAKYLGRATMIALLGTSVVRSVEDLKKSEKAEQLAYINYLAGNVAYEEYEQARAAKDAVSENFWLWQGMNVAFMGMEAHTLKGLMTGYRAEKGSQQLMEAYRLAAKEEAAKALEGAELKLPKARDVDSVFAHIDDMARTRGGEWNDVRQAYIANTKESLSGLYKEKLVKKLGADAWSKLENGDDIVALAWFEKEAQLKAGMTGEKLLKLREQAVDAISCCLSGKCSI